jgi:hypothetical protein
MTPADHAQLLKPAKTVWQLMLDGRAWKVHRDELGKNLTIRQVRSRATSYASYHNIKVLTRVLDDDWLMFQFVGQGQPRWHDGSSKEERGRQL